MKKRGFTIVELIITITIMGVLLILAVVNVNATQAKARDDERTTDVQAIALHLESFYATGKDGSTTLGRYPSTGLFTGGLPTIRENLRDIDVKSISAPGVTDPTLTFITATNGIQTVVGALPQPTTSQYVYQPIKTDGTLCTSGNTDCRKFNIYYRLETDTVNPVHMITSKNQ